MAKRESGAVPTAAPVNPLIETDGMLADNLSRVHSYAVFLQSHAEQATLGLMDGEQNGRQLAHEVLANALKWLKDRADCELRHG
jgi:hypothetical protein